MVLSPIYRNPCRVVCSIYCLILSRHNCVQVIVLIPERNSCTVWKNLLRRFVLSSCFKPCHSISISIFNISFMLAPSNYKERMKIRLKIPFEWWKHPKCLSAPCEVWQSTIRWFNNYYKLSNMEKTCWQCSHLSVHNTFQINTLLSVGITVVYLLHGYCMF